MSLIQLTIKHGRTLEEARQALERSVKAVCTQFAGMIERVEWSPDRNSVSLWGSGCTAELRVDPVEVHFCGDIPILGGLLGAPIAAGLKQIIHQNFQKQLTGPRP
jgi:hypothetical protein